MSPVSKKQSAMRRVKVSVEIEIPEDALANLAEEALNTGVELSKLIADRYLTVRAARTPEPVPSAPEPQAEQAGRRRTTRRRGAKQRKSESRRSYAVRDFPHLFHRNPEGERPYRGSGRPPQWLLNLIEEELRQGAARQQPAEDRSLPVPQEG